MFFKVNNVSNRFNMTSLFSTLIRKEKGYDINIHYKYFIIEYQ